jgi:hypothetical protein
VKFAPLLKTTPKRQQGLKQLNDQQEELLEKLELPDRALASFASNIKWF